MKNRPGLARLGYAGLSLFALTIFVFLLVRLTGDPLQLLLPDSASAEDYARMRAKLGLDQSLPAQYISFLTSAVRGDFGNSIRLQAPVIEIIRQRLPASLLLGATALVLAVGVGVPLGVYAAYRRGGWFDGGARLFAVLGQSAPSFWVGLLLILLFGVRLGWLPAGGSGGPRHLILPAFTMAWVAIAGVTRLVRSSMTEVLETDYIKFLRIKGVPERTIIWKHGLRNAGLAALTYVGVLTASLLTGSVVVETVFVWPGIGQLMAESIAGRDFPIIQAVVLLISSIYIGANLIVDLLYTVLNPRLRKLTISDSGQVRVAESGSG